MKVRISIIVAAICISIGSFAQVSSGIITGRVLGGSEPIAYANVIMLTKDSLLLDGTTTSSDGEFSLESPSSGEKLIKISYLGYLSKIIPTNFSAGNHSMGDISLEQSNKVLNEVVVTASVPVYSLKGSNMVVNVENSVLKNIGAAINVVENIPGILISDDKVTVFGKGSPIIYINNRKINDERELQRLQSTDISTVELINNPGAKYDAEGRAVLIIKTKEKAMNGLSVQVSEELRKAGSWYDSEYVGLSYNLNNLSLFSSYSHGAGKGKTREETAYTIFADTLWEQQVNTPHKFQYDYNQLTAGFDWSITPKHAVGAQYQGYFSSEKSFIFGETSILSNGIPYDHMNSGSNSKTSPRQHLMNGFYKGDYSDKLKIQIDFDYLDNKSERSQNTNETTDVEGDRTVTLYSQSDFSLYAGKFTADYNLNKNGSFEFGGEYNQVTGSGYLLNPEGYVKSDEYTNKEKKSATFLSYKNNLGKLNVQIGLRYEHALEQMTEGKEKVVKVNKTTGDLFPSISLSVPIKKVQMSLAFNRRIKRPSFSQLNQNNIYVNRFILQKGNPYLLKEDIYEINCNLMYKFISIRSNYIYKKDPIHMSFIVNEGSSSISTVLPVNFPKYQAINALVTLNPKLGVWQPKFTTGFEQPFFETHYKNEVVRYNRTNLILQFNNDFVFPKKYILSVNMYCQSDYDRYATAEGGYKRLDLGLRKSFLNDNLTFNLQARDVFNWVKEKHIQKINEISFNQDKKRETQYLTFSVRYQFNNNDKKYRGSNAAKDDINRL